MFTILHSVSTAVGYLRGRPSPSQPSQVDTGGKKDKEKDNEDGKWRCPTCNNRDIREDSLAPLDGMFRRKSKNSFYVPKEDNNTDDGCPSPRIKIRRTTLNQRRSCDAILKRDDGGRHHSGPEMLVMNKINSAERLVMSHPPMEPMEPMEVGETNPLPCVQSMVNINTVGSKKTVTPKALSPLTPTFNRALSTSVLRIKKRRSFWEKFVT